jgi:hypothetical protein
VCRRGRLRRRACSATRARRATASAVASMAYGGARVPEVLSAVISLSFWHAIEQSFWIILSISSCSVFSVITQGGRGRIATLLCRLQRGLKVVLRGQPTGGGE